MELEYTGFGFLNVKTDTGRDAALSGMYNLIIENAGINPAISPPTNLPDIDISVT
mgnify:FL=1